MSQIALALREMAVEGKLPVLTGYLGICQDDASRAFFEKLMLNTMLEQWVEKGVVIRGKEFQKSPPGLTDAELQAVPQGAVAASGDPSQLSFEVCALRCNKPVIKDEEEAFWKTAPQKYVDQFLEVRDRHMEEYSGLLVSLASQRPNNQEDPSAAGAVYAPSTKYNSVAELKAAVQVKREGKLEPSKVMMVTTTDGKRFVWSDGVDKVLPRLTHLGGFGQLSFDPAATPGAKCFKYDLPEGDQSIVEYETGSAADDVSYQANTFYGLVKSLERDGFTNIIDNIGHTTCKRQVVNGRDTINIVVDGSYYKIHSHVTNVNWDAAKAVFAEMPETIASEVCCCCGCCCCC